MGVNTQITAESVARYIIFLSSRDSEPLPITHMQLQKLLYYIQGWSLGLHAEPAFVGRMEAWQHGPVVTDVYSRFADFRAEAIKPSEGRDIDAITPRERRHIDAVWNTYNGFSASRLREMTHRERPWLDARRGLRVSDQGHAEITHESLREYFADQARRAPRIPGLSPDELRESREQARRGEVMPIDF
jgi:uncharacterized phage-associated protein